MGCAPLADCALCHMVLLLHHFDAAFHIWVQRANVGERTNICKCVLLSFGR